MVLEWKDMLKKYSRDENSFQKLHTLFTELREEKDQAERSLQLLEAAIRDDYDSILITDLNLEEPGPKIVYVNKGFTRMTGYEREEVIGKSPRILHGPKTDRQVLEKLKKRLSEGKSFFGQTVNYRKDGSEFVNQWDIHPLTNEKGELTHWVSYQHDITERKRAEKILTDASVEFDRLREISHQAVVDVDREGNIVMANRSFRELVGYDREEIKQIKVWDLFHRKYRDSLKSRFDEGADEEKFGNRKFKGIVKHKNDSPIQIGGSTNLLEFKDQTLIRAVVKNISLQKRILDTLNKRNKDYSRIVEKASEFVYRLKLEKGEPIFKSLSEHFPVLTGVSPLAVKKEGGYKEFIHPGDLDKVRSFYSEVMQGGSGTCSYRIKKSGDEYIRIVDYAKPVWENEKGLISTIRGAVSLDSEKEPVI